MKNKTYSYGKAKNVFGCSKACFRHDRTDFQIYTQPQDKLKAMGFSKHIVATIDADEETVKKITELLNANQA